MISRKMSLKTAIKNVVNYYYFFNYAPSFEEIFLYLSKKTTKKQLEDELVNLVLKKQLILLNKQKKGQKSRNFASNIYAIPPQRISDVDQNRSKIVAASKIAYIRGYIDKLMGVSAIRLAGISGSVSMGHAGKGDDIDLFIIASKNRLWTARFLAIFWAWSKKLKRSRNVKKAPNKVCLNLFFDESELSVPKYKQNLYTAHEVLQMKPLFAKGNTYKKYLQENKWVREFFPNLKLDTFFLASSGPARTDLIATAHVPNRQKNVSALSMVIGDMVEAVLKKIQLMIISRHKTTEIVTEKQLWFFPDDFEKRLRKNKIID